MDLKLLGDMTQHTLLHCLYDKEIRVQIQALELNSIHRAYSPEHGSSRSICRVRKAKNPTLKVKHIRRV